MNIARRDISRVAGALALAALAVLAGPPLPPPGPDKPGKHVKPVWCNEHGWVSPNKDGQCPDCEDDDTKDD